MISLDGCCLTYVMQAQHKEGNVTGPRYQKAQYLMWGGKDTLNANIKNSKGLKG